MNRKEIELINSFRMLDGGVKHAQNYLFGEGGPYRQTLISMSNRYLPSEFTKLEVEKKKEIYEHIAASITAQLFECGDDINSSVPEFIANSVRKLVSCELSETEDNDTVLSRLIGCGASGWDIAAELRKGGKYRKTLEDTSKKYLPYSFFSLIAKDKRAIFDSIASEVAERISKYEIKTNVKGYIYRTITNCFDDRKFREEIMSGILAPIDSSEFDETITEYPAIVQDWIVREQAEDEELDRNAYVKFMKNRDALLEKLIRNCLTPDLQELANECFHTYHCAWGTMKNIEGQNYTKVQRMKWRLAEGALREDLSEEHLPGRHIDRRAAFKRFVESEWLQQANVSDQSLFPVLERKLEEKELLFATTQSTVNELTADGRYLVLKEIIKDKKRRFILMKCDAEVPDAYLNMIKDDGGLFECLFKIDLIGRYFECNGKDDDLLSRDDRFLMGGISVNYWHEYFETPKKAVSWEEVEEKDHVTEEDKITNRFRIISHNWSAYFEKYGNLASEDEKTAVGQLMSKAKTPEGLKVAIEKCPQKNADGLGKKIKSFSYVVIEQYRNDKAVLDDVKCKILNGLWPVIMGKAGDSEVFFNADKTPGWKQGRAAVENYRKVCPPREAPVADALALLFEKMSLDDVWGATQRSDRNVLAQQMQQLFNKAYQHELNWLDGRISSIKRDVDFIIARLGRCYNTNN